MRKTLTSLAIGGAVALSGCEMKVYDSQFWIPNCEFTPGFDVSYTLDDRPYLGGNVLRIGKMYDQRDKSAGFDPKAGLLIADDKDKDGIFDKIEFFRMEEGSPLESYADRNKLKQIVMQIVESEKK